MVKAIIVEIGDRQIKLTLDEAAKLKDALDSLFVRPTPWYPYPCPVYPSAPAEPWKITYTSDTAAVDPAHIQKGAT